MADRGTAPEHFAFSRRDPGKILALARKRQRAHGMVRALALGGQPRDRVYFSQLLANTLGLAFAQVDLGLRGMEAAEEKLMLERLLAFGRAAPAVLLIDGSETVFAERDGRPQSERAALLAGYLNRVLKDVPGIVVFGMPEQVSPDYGELVALDMAVSFRAPSGQVIAGRPVLLPSYLVDEPVLPVHNFRVEVDDVEVGLCAVSAPQLLAGPYSGLDFNPPDGIGAFQALEVDDRARWPTITLRRAVTQSRLFFDWKASQYGGKPLIRHLRLHQLDWSGEKAVNTWIVRDCWAKRWTGPAFDAMQAAVAEEEIELYYRELSWQ